MGEQLIKYRIREEKFDKVTKYYPEFRYTLQVTDTWNPFAKYKKRFLSNQPIFFYTFDEAKTAVEKHKAEYEKPKETIYHEL